MGNTPFPALAFAPASLPDPAAVAAGLGPAAAVAVAGVAVVCHLYVVGLANC